MFVNEKRLAVRAWDHPVSAHRTNSQLDGLLTLSLQKSNSLADSPNGLYALAFDAENEISPIPGPIAEKLRFVPIWKQRMQVASIGGYFPQAVPIPCPASKF